MSRYFIQPEVNTWKNIIEPFSFSIIAYDNNNRRITNKQFYIIYDITTDGTTPDLGNGTVLYSNNDGVIELELDQKCRISIEVYFVNIFDENLNIDSLAEEYIHQNICDNLLLPFEPYIQKFEAVYASAVPIAVTDPVRRKYTKVTLYKSNGTVVSFTLEKALYDSYIIEPTTISNVGLNTLTVKYYDDLLEKEWQCNIEVLGKSKEIEIYSIYKGEKKHLNNVVLKTEVSVYLKLYDGVKYSITPLIYTEWEFTSFPQVTNLNEGHFILIHNSLKCGLTVPFYWISYKWKLDAWYEGFPVKVGNKFVPGDFRIYLYREDGIVTYLKLDECSIDSKDYVVPKEGINWYTVSYRANDYTLKDKVAIIGYVEKECPEEEWSIHYFDPNLQTYIDMTSIFVDSCKMNDEVYFNWGKILNRINSIKMFGTYKLYAPIFTGLSTTYDTEWIIYCDSRRGIRSQLFRNIYKEEEE
jgi:hypothetical protein